MRFATCKNALGDWRCRTFSKLMREKCVWNASAKKGTWAKIAKKRPGRKSQKKSDLNNNLHETWTKIAKKKSDSNNNRKKKRLERTSRKKKRSEQTSQKKSDISKNRKKKRLEQKSRKKGDLSLSKHHILNRFFLHIAFSNGTFSTFCHTFIYLCRIVSTRLGKGQR